MTDAEVKKLCERILALHPINRVASHSARPVAKWALARLSERSAPPMEREGEGLADFIENETGPYMNNLSKTQSLELADKILRSFAAPVAEGWKDTVRAFLNKYDTVIPALDGAFAFQAVHGMEYRGEDWGAELEALRSLVETSARTETKDLPPNGK